MALGNFFKPEAGHAKAKELIDVGKKLSALEVLYEMMKFRRARSWQKSLEEPMMLFVDLCIELKKNQHFKRIIHQYRNITIQECPQSLDDVLKHYFNLIKAKTVEARQESKDAVPDIEDLEIMETPESLMLNAVGTEGAQGRSDHTILMPWLKFLWEAYRIGLDLVRNNSKFEHVYHRIARDAFDFCLEYRRRTEFRKLSEMLRMHTARLQVQPAAQNAISLTNSDTQILHFETRLRQLDCAMDLEMYNEAFKIIEDIWGLVLLAKKIDRPSLMSDYYSKVAELFLKSGCYLFHAAALYKKLSLIREHKRAPTAEELSVLGSKALCAALSVPLPHAKVQFSLFSGEYNQAKQKALANLLGLSTVPSRVSLLADLSLGRIQNIVPPELCQLYQALEIDFQPLNIVERVKPALSHMTDGQALSVYKTPLQEVIVSKTLLQLSQVYRSLHFVELVKLCPFYNALSLERCVTELIYNLDLPMRVDHRKQAIIFDVHIDLGISQNDYAHSIGLPIQAQTGGTDQLSKQLALFAQSLQQVCEVLNLNDSSDTDRDSFVEEYRRIADTHHRELLSRRYYIENRKEQLETIQEERAKFIEVEEQRIESEKILLRQREEDMLRNEAVERERRKSDEEHTRLKRKIARERLAILLGSEAGGKSLLKDISEEQLDQFNAESAMEKKFIEAAKKRRDLLEKANSRAKKLDHLTRAIRLEELPLLRDFAKNEQQERKDLHECAQKELEEKSRLEHENLLKNRTRLARMKADYLSFTKTLKQKATLKYKSELTEWEQLCTQARAERMAERNAKLEAELLLAEEAERKLKEEAERAEQLKKKAEEAERVRKEMEAAAKAKAELMKREAEELERKQRETATKADRDLWARGSKYTAPPSKFIPKTFVDDGVPRGQPRSRVSNFERSEPSTQSSGFERKPTRLSQPPSFGERANSGWTRKAVQNKTADPTPVGKSSTPQNDDGEWKAVNRRH